MVSHSIRAVRRDSVTTNCWPASLHALRSVKHAQAITASYLRICSLGLAECDHDTLDPVLIRDTCRDVIRELDTFGISSNTQAHQHFPVGELS